MSCMQRHRWRSSNVVMMNIRGWIDFGSHICNWDIYNCGCHEQKALQIQTAEVSHQQGLQLNCAGMSQPSCAVRLLAVLVSAVQDVWHDKLVARNSQGSWPSLLATIGAGTGAAACSGPFGRYTWGAAIARASTPAGVCTSKRMPCDDTAWEYTDAQQLRSMSRLDTSLRQHGMRCTLLYR